MTGVVAMGSMCGLSGTRGCCGGIRSARCDGAAASGERRGIFFLKS